MYTHPEFVQLSADVTDADGHTFPAGTLYGDMVQYYLDKLERRDPDVADACNGWFNAEKAQKYLAAAKEELGDSASWPINIDITYYSASAATPLRLRPSSRSSRDPGRRQRRRST